MPAWKGIKSRLSSSSRVRLSQLRPVGVHIAAVAGKMLQGRGHPFLPGPAHHLPDKLSDLPCIPSEAAGIDEVLGIVGEVGHRSQVEPDAQSVEKGAFLPGVLLYCFPAALVIGLPGREKFLRPKPWVSTDAAHGTPLFIHGEKDGYFGILLPAFGVCLDLSGVLPFKVPAKEQHAAGGQGFYFRPLFGQRASDQKDLPQLFFQGHFRKPLPGQGQRRLW